MKDPRKCVHENTYGPDDVGMISCTDCGGSWPWSIDDYMQTMSHVANGPVEDFPLPVDVLRAWLIALRAGGTPAQAFEQVGVAATSDGASKPSVVFLSREEVLILLRNFQENQVTESEAILTSILSSRKLYAPADEMVKVPKRLLEGYFNNDFTEADELELQAVLADHNLKATKANDSAD